MRLEITEGKEWSMSVTGVGSVSVVWDLRGSGIGFAIHLNAEGGQRGLQRSSEIQFTF